MINHGYAPVEILQSSMIPYCLKVHEKICPTLICIDMYCNRPISSVVIGREVDYRF